MDRRRYLATLGAVGAGATGGLAGCGGLVETESVGQPALVENRPDAVYVPSHVEGMRMIDVAMAGRLRLALSYSYAHRFWLVTGDRTNMVEIADEDSAHLMVNVWDGETETAIPSANASLTVTRDGETVLEKSMWPMLSQNMGFHYGDNVALDGDGTYEVEVRFGAVGTRRTGAFGDAFGEQVRKSFTFEFSANARDEIGFETLGRRAGQEDALDPMQMEMMSVAQLPAADDLPGTRLGRGSVGDATIVGTLLDAEPDGVEGSGPYLAVSPRTPYNRYPIPFMPISAAVTDGGEELFSGALTATLDPALGYHHGAVVEDMDDGADVEVTVVNAAQVARHEGYETAFLESGIVTLSDGES